MNREKAREILGEGATEEQITNLLNNYHFEESSKVKDLESKIDSLTQTNSKYSDYDTIKKELDDIKKANMTEQEKFEAMKKATEENFKISKMAVARAKAREILAGENLTDDDIEDLVSDDLDKTIEKATRWKNNITNIKSNIEKVTTEKLTTVDLKPTIPNVNPNENVIDSFEKFANMSAEEQNKWLQDNPNGLEKLN